MPRHPFPVYFLSKKVKVKKEFFGSSPPSIFVGSWNYPKVFTGILSPTESFKEASLLDSPETWYKLKLNIKEILSLRKQMVYSRFKANVTRHDSKLNEIQKELAQSIRPCEIEIKLKKPPILNISSNNFSPPIPNPGQIERARLTENPKIPKEIDKVVNDSDIASNQAVEELYYNKIKVTHIQKILSAGLLGTKNNKRLVPTRWSITAVDNMLSSSLLKDIKHYPELSEHLLFENTYLGNHYWILMIPRHWSFQLIEISKPGSEHAEFWTDWEDYFPRKKYAKNCVGGYYAARLSVCEYLKKIRRQATVLIIREISPLYNTPLGVWVPRETTKGAFEGKPEKFESLEQAISTLASKIKTPWKKIIALSSLLRILKNQKNLKNFL